MTWFQSNESNDENLEIRQKAKYICELPCGGNIVKHSISQIYQSMRVTERTFVCSHLLPRLKLPMHTCRVLKLLTSRVYSKDSWRKAGASMIVIPQI